jgi:hypothetical protein
MPLYIITADTVLDTDVYHVVDTTVPDHITATCFNRADAEFVAAKLNGPRNQTNPRLRPLAAMEICDFRLLLEHENGGPLTGDPQIAFFLSDLCDFLGFNTGERALALGAQLLVYLSQLDCPPDVPFPVSTPVTQHYADRLAAITIIEDR